ncbi:methyl-accepting chemotaxis protein [Bradyrhizobium sp. RDT10]
MLMMRGSEKDFILRGHDKYGVQLVDREAEFETELAQASLPPEVKSEILGLIRAYKSSFVSLVETQQSLSNQVDDLGQIYDQIRPMILKIMAAADARSQAAEARAEEIRRKLIWMIGFATTVVGLLALTVQPAHRENSRFDDGRQCQLGDGRFDVGARSSSQGLVELIAAIARHINLVALNATIEAARAGDLGRGFAIVAQDVKALARQAAHATVEIREHTGGIQVATAEPVGAVTKIGVIIGRISEIAFLEAHRKGAHDRLCARGCRGWICRCRAWRSNLVICIAKQRGSRI